MVKQSLKSLKCAAEYGLKCPESVSLVETYLNMSNSQCHIGNLNKSLESITVAIQMCNREIRQLQ